jgi:tagatose-6-phosphate ketose/aldose isomerase
MERLSKGLQQESDFEPENYLGFKLSELQLKGGGHTAREISQQPILWLDTFGLLASRRLDLQAFLDEVYAHDDLDIILTGAGTSAFIGNILQGPFQRISGKKTWAVATTDLVSHPDNYFHREAATLLVSFARSGNSPESLAAVNLANTCCEKVYHLIITCNPSGKLARDIGGNATFVFLCPKEADDQSLAMTASFTCMLLAGLLISRLDKLEGLRGQVERLSRYGDTVIRNYAEALWEASGVNFNRAIFLGSGPLQGTAKESHLKLQELTDGKVICKHDSFLGFRHGPKAVIDPSTLLIYLFSNNEYAHQYEIDLVKAINAGEKGLYRIGIFEAAAAGLELDLTIALSSDQEKLEEDFLSICSVVPAQMLGFYKSLRLGLRPDSPSVNGTITRVVEGVNIYPFLYKPAEMVV